MQDKNRKKMLIIGGGYLGAMTALMASQIPEFEVVLLEKQDKLGGLYNTAWSCRGQHFDFGSRAILETGVPLLDDLLFSILPDNEYPKSTANLREFSYQNGHYHDHSNCLDARSLPNPLFEAGLAEMLQISDHGKGFDEFETLFDYSVATYGPTFTQHLIRPALEKLTGLPLEKTDPLALAIHGLHRIIIADQDASKTMKDENPFNGSRIAYARFDDNKSQTQKTYPRTSGLKDFGNRILNYLQDAPNVEVILGNSAIGLDLSSEGQSSIQLEDGSRLEFDHMIWTIPSVFLGKLIGTDLSKLRPPRFRNTVLAHYLFEGKTQTDAFYIYNYDPSFVSYRSTFYSNFSTPHPELNAVTVEIFHDALNPDLDALRETVFSELKAAGHISQDSSMIESNLHFHRGSWPNFDTEFFTSQQDANKIIGADLQNIWLTGKANGKHHSGALVQSAFEILRSIQQAC